MSDFPTGTATILGRCVSAEIRARLAARRLSQRELTTGAGFASLNYVATRLRDEKPFTLDDVERIALYLDPSEEPDQLILTAVDRQSEEIWDQVMTSDRVPDRELRIGAAQPNTETDEEVTSPLRQ